MSWAWTTTKKTKSISLNLAIASIFIENMKYFWISFNSISKTTKSPIYVPHFRNVLRNYFHLIKFPVQFITGKWFYALISNERTRTIFSMTFFKPEIQRWWFRMLTKISWINNSDIILMSEQKRQQKIKFITFMVCLFPKWDVSSFFCVCVASDFCLYFFPINLDMM